MPAYTQVGVIAEVKNFGGFMGSLNKMNKGIQQTGKTTDTAAKRTGGFGKNVLSLQTALAGLGLAGIVSQFGQFAVGAFNASAAAERLFTATDNLAQAIGSSGEAMVSAITTASKETISKTAAMTAANKAMMFGLVENEDQMGRLTEIAITLGAAMGQDAAKSLDDLTTALGRQSPMILDNLGITLKLEEAYKIYAAQLGKNVDALTEQEKKQAFVTAALIKGEERVKELGGVTIDTAGKTEQLSAAWSDFTVAFGDLLAMASGGISTVTKFVRSLEEGAQAWQQVFKDISAIQAYNAEMSQAGEITQEAIDMVANSNDAFMAMQGSVEGVNEAIKEQATVTDNAIFSTDEYRGAFRRITDVTTETTAIIVRSADEHRHALGEMGESYREVGKASVEATRIQKEMMASLRLTTAGYFNSFREHQESAAQSEADFASRMSEIRGGAAEAQTEAASALSDELANIEQERADKLQWVMTGAHNRTAEENAAALGHWNAHYDELAATAKAKTREKTDALIAEQSRAESAAAAAREKEKAEMAAHLEELKLKTVLAMMETTGQLEQMTGLIGISAADAAELITAGVLPVTQEMGQAIQATMGNMESSMAAASETAAANQEILQAALGGTLTGAEELGTGMTNMLTPVEEVSTAIAGIGGGEGAPALTSVSTQIQDIGTEFGTSLPTNITATDEALLLFSESALLQLQPVLDKVKEINAQFLEAYTVHLPTLGTITMTTSQVMVDAILQVNAVLAEMLGLIIRITAKIIEMGEAAKEAAGELADMADTSDLKDLMDILEDIEEKLWDIKTAASEVVGALSGMGGALQGIGIEGGAGIRMGIGLQAGMGANTGGPLGLGYRIPPGYPNDTFGPLFVQSGEEMLVTPRGV